MAQYDFGTIDPNTKSGTALATDLNSYRNAVNSMHSGSAAPSYITAGMMWVDTTSADYELKLYDGAQSITVAIIDATNNVARVAVDPAETSYITSTTSAQIRHVIASTDIFTTRSTGIQFNLASPVIADSNNNELISFTTTASAVNQLNIANSATGGAVQLSTVGADTDVSIALMPKGAGGVGIGTAVPVSPLHVYLTDATTYGDGTAALDTTNLIRVQNGSQVDDTYSGIQLASENAAGTVGWWSIASVSTSSNYDNDLVFHTRTGSTTYAERARIDASGNLLIGTTDSAPTVNNVAGFSFLPAAGSLQVNAEANLHRMGRRQDGTIIGLYSAGDLEGTISIAGTTTSYNGGHLSRWAQLPDNSRPELLKGTVMSNLDQMSNWSGEDNEQLNCVQVSTAEGDANVAGVFVAWDSEDDGYNDILLAMTGDMVIRIAAGTTVQRGDLLMSAGDGTAKPQGDDIVRAKTIAKVTSTHVSHAYEDGSYAVPCVLMAC